MGWFRRHEPEDPPRAVDTEEVPEVGGDRMVFWKFEEQIDDVDYGPVWIANFDGEILTDPELWLSYAEAEEFARGRELPLEEV